MKLTTTQMLNDTEFCQNLITRVESIKNGWSILMEDVWSIHVPNDACDETPIVGEVIRLFGKGIGHPVRGIAIGERLYSYVEKDVFEKAQEALRASLKKDREEQEAVFRASKKPDLPSFQLRAPEEWADWVANNQDPYGFACVQYAATWASLMEKEMSKGVPLVKIANAASRAADTEGITGFMYGAAVSMLSSCWEHGEELRRWHNLKTQVSNEGERANESGAVLNPALMTIEGPDES